VEFNANATIGEQAIFRLRKKLVITKQPNPQYNSAEEQKLNCGILAEN